MTNPIGFAQHCTKNFQLLFRLKNNTSLSLFDIQDAFILFEELIITTDTVLSPDPLTTNDIDVIYDVAIIAMVHQFQITQNEYTSIEYGTIANCLKQLLEGHVGTVGQLSKLELWSELRDNIELLYCETEPYTDQIDIIVADKTLRTIVGYDFSNPTCIYT